MEILFTVLQFKGFEQEKRQETAIYMKIVTDVVIFSYISHIPVKIYMYILCNAWRGTITILILHYTIILAGQ